jgi:arylformamidase
LAKDFDLPADTIKGGICISGMFDLKPVWLSARSTDVEFDDGNRSSIPMRRSGRAALA